MFKDLVLVEGPGAVVSAHSLDSPALTAERLGAHLSGLILVLDQRGRIAATQRVWEVTESEVVEALSAGLVGGSLRFLEFPVGEARELRAFSEPRIVVRRTSRERFTVAGESLGWVDAKQRLSRLMAEAIWRHATSSTFSEGSVIATCAHAP